MRFEVIMKGDNDYRIYDNLNNEWCYVLEDDTHSHIFKTRETAFIAADALNGSTPEETADAELL